MRIALGQAPSRPGDVAGNLATAATLAIEAARAGARILALPELFSCGYDPATWTTPVDDELPVVRAAAKRADIWILLGANVRRHNAIVVIAPDGSVRGHYAKMHLWRDENTAFTPGAGLFCIDADGMRVGLGICYDAGFPEFARAYAVAGADAVVFCSAFATGATESRYEIYHPARALENTMYVLAVNAVGEQGGERYFGRSGAWQPDGRELVRAGWEPELRVAELDRAALTRARQELPYLRQIRDPHHAPVHLEGADHAADFSRS